MGILGDMVSQIRESKFARRNVTIVPADVKKAVTERPDWPEVEQRLKRVLGENWRLVTYEEFAASEPGG